MGTRRRHVARTAPTALVLASVLAAPPARSATGRPLVIDAIGDSITLGVVRSGDTSRTMDLDPDGGWAARLGRLLGPGVEVRPRGVGGATAADWLRADRRATDLVGPLHELWPDLAANAGAGDRRSDVLSIVLAADRPDLVLLLLGVNDLHRDADLGGPPSPASLAARLAALARRARRTGARVVVLTMPPNERDDAGALAEANRLLCAAEPDCLRVDEAMRAGGPGLLGDEVHPAAAGHAVIAATVARELRLRGIVTGAADGSAAGATAAPR